MAMTVSNLFGLAPNQPSPVVNPGFGGSWIVEYTGDASYPTGGYALVLPPGITQISVLVPVATNTAGVIALWDQANQKIVLHYPTGSTVAAPAAIGDPILNAGATAVTASAATGPFTAGRSKQLANTTDASTVKIYCILVGR